MIDVGSAISRSAQVAQVESTGGYFLLPLGGDSCEVLALLGTSAQVWRATGLPGITVRKVIDAVAHDVGIAPDDIEEDVQNFIAALVERGLLTVGD